MLPFIVGNQFAILQIFEEISLEFDACFRIIDVGLHLKVRIEAAVVEVCRAYGTEFVIDDKEFRVVD